MSTQSMLCSSSMDPNGLFYKSPSLVLPLLVPPPHTPHTGDEGRSQVNGQECAAPCREAHQRQPGAPGHKSPCCVVGSASADSYLPCVSLSKVLN